jgi:hypothetical protein
MQALATYVIRSTLMASRRYLAFYTQLYANAWRWPLHYRLEDHRITVELAKHTAATAALVVLAINMIGWLGDSWYADQMADTPALAIVLLLYTCVYVLALVAWISNRIYPRRPVSYGAYANLATLGYLFMLPGLLVTMLVSPEPASGPAGFLGWRGVAFAVGTSLGSLAVSAVLFRSDMLLFGFGVRRTLIAMLPRLVVALAMNLAMLAVLMATTYVWTLLPVPMQEVLQRLSEGAWRLISSL